MKMHVKVLNGSVSVRRKRLSETLPMSTHKFCFVEKQTNYGPRYPPYLRLWLTLHAGNFFHDFLSSDDFSQN